jgi:hypothetical protein
MSLPDDNEVFSRYFDRWYDDSARQRKSFSFTRPDMVRAYESGLLGADLSPLVPTGQTKVLGMIQTMLESAKSDWASYLDLSDGIDCNSIEAIDFHYDAESVEALIERSDPNDFANDLVVLICQFGAVLGPFFIQQQPRLCWIPDQPYWESSLYDPISGYVIPPFHWAIKKFSSYGIDDGCLPKALRCLEILEEATASQAQ